MIQFENAVEKFNKTILKDLYDSGIKVWIAGGCLRDYFMGMPLKTDIDLFFPDEANFLLTKKFFKHGKAKTIWESDNGMKVKYNGHTYDLIKHYFSDPQSCINDFDFTVCMLAVDKDKVYFGETTFIDLSKRQLMIQKLLFPPSSLRRAFRYYQKGFAMCVGEMAKLVEAIQNMPKPEPNTENANDEEISKNDVGGMWIGID